MAQNWISMDKRLVPGQKVRVVRTVEYAFTVDIADYLAETDDPDVSVEDLQLDIEDNHEVSDISDDYGDVDEVTISVEVVEVN